MLCLISFCLILLLESPANARSKTVEKLAPRDTIELRVWRWTALRDGVLEALQLNNTFTIDSNGTLDLPMIGNIVAAGLREKELAELISDRLQARSGRQERADTTVKRIQDPSSDITGSVEHPGKQKAPEAPADAADGSPSAVASERTGVEKGQVEAQPSVRGSDITWEPAAEQQQALDGERLKMNALLNELSAARLEIAAARREALAARQTARNGTVRYNQNLATERQRAATLMQELDAVRTDRGALEQKLFAVRTDRGLLEQKLFAALREVDALNKSVQPARGDHEAVLRRELAAARAELDTMQRGARDASAQARAVADTMAGQGQALKQQRRRAEELALDLEAAQREAEGLKAKAILADREKAAMLEARHSMEASLAEAQRALDEERHKAERFERELTAARQTIDALKTRANLAAVAQTNAIKDRQVAEAALKRVGDALELERQRADSVRRERDAAKADREKAVILEARHSMGASLAEAQRALDEERHMAERFERELTAARQTIDALKTRANLAAVAQTNAIKDRQVAEAALKRVGDALELERQRADSVRRERDAAKANREKAAILEARHSMGASLAEAQRALDEERHKAERFERELTAARQTIDALKTRANLTAVAQTNAIKDRQVAEAALKRAGDELERERERADSAARDLASARRERDAAKQEASRVSTELSAALEQERNKAIGLARDLSAARKAIDIVKAKGERRTERMKRAPKARATAVPRADVSARLGAQPARQPLRENHKVKVKRPSRSVLVATIALPDALLPTRPPKLGSR
ncbi:polysaccharide biosynthesis/export family protein [Mesorhizobium sp. M9A.F.Ca.ET.002.03.1.2]|uniref:polysaccharide biosynthesis/export family protein n=1 Tax=Mesorhizobium sp. M9A.F.Ca.ET.002.03.1.2 TaxID=2493668 RepID=UPI0016720FB1|nr:polysaccharide biosynthesis/export family protein [Mesorhizobium sp. M9A.F.Ca.ET.002.03.1.2]